MYEAYNNKPILPYTLPNFLAKNIKPKIITVIEIINNKSCFAKISGIENLPKNELIPKTPRTL